MLPCLRFGLTALAGRDLERRDQHRACRPRLDHLVDVAALGGVVRVREALLVVGDQLGAARLRVVRLLELLAEDDVDGSLRPHHRDLGRRPGDVEVGADVLRTHDVVGAAVGLARDHRQLRHGRLRECVEKLRTVADDPPHSCTVPGRKPGTSTKVTSGTLKASHVRTKRAALTDASMSSTPRERPAGCRRRRRGGRQPRGSRERCWRRNAAAPP